MDAKNQIFRKDEERLKNLSKEKIWFYTIRENNW
mgnify:CR=1 FL=1